MGLEQRHSVNAIWNNWKTTCNVYKMVIKNICNIKIFIDNVIIFKQKDFSIISATLIRKIWFCEVPKGLVIGLSGTKGSQGENTSWFHMKELQKIWRMLFIFVQKSWSVLKILQFLVFKDNWTRIIYAKVMTSHLSNPYIVTYKNVNKGWNIASLHTKLCRVIDHYILHLSKEKVMLVGPPVASSRPLCVFVDVAKFPDSKVNFFWRSIFRIGKSMWLTGENLKLSLQLIVCILHCDRKHKGTWN